VAVPASAACQEVRIRGDADFRVLRVFLGADQETCGADTLYLCARLLGREPSLRQLDRQLPATAKGASLASLADAALASGLPGELIEVDLARLRRWRTPAILFVNDGHFVGFVGTSESGRLLLFDNAIGLVECTPEWFAARYRWRGESLLLGPAPSPWSEAFSSPWLIGPALLAGLLMISLSFKRRPRPAPSTRGVQP